jgi:hypothetical protein
MFLHLDLPKRRLEVAILIQPLASIPVRNYAGEVVKPNMRAIRLDEG